MRKLAIAITVSALAFGCELFLSTDDLVLQSAADAGADGSLAGPDGALTDAQTEPPDAGTDSGLPCELRFELPDGAVVFPSGYLRSDTKVTMVASPETATIYYTVDGTLPSIADGDFGGTATAKAARTAAVDLKAPTGTPTSNPWVNNQTKLTIKAIATVPDPATDGGVLICPSQTAPPAVDKVFPGNVFKEGYDFAPLIGYATSAVAADGPIDVTTTIKKPAGDQMGLAINSQDPLGTLYFAEENQVRKIDPSKNLSTVVPASAGLNGPAKMVFDGAGNLYIADTGTNQIKRWNGTSLSTFVGGGTNPMIGNTAVPFQTNSQVKLDAVKYLAMSPDFSKLYLTTAYNHLAVVNLTAAPRTITYLADFNDPNNKVPGPNGALGEPRDLATDADGNLLVICSNLRILKMDAKTGAISVLLEWSDPGYGAFSWGTSMSLGMDGFIYYGWQVSGAVTFMRRNPTTGAQIGLYRDNGLYASSSVMDKAGTLFVFSTTSTPGGPAIVTFK